MHFLGHCFAVCTCFHKSCFLIPGKAVQPGASRGLLCGAHAAPARRHSGGQDHTAGAGNGLDRHQSQGWNPRESSQHCAPLWRLFSRYDVSRSAVVCYASFQTMQSLRGRLRARCQLVGGIVHLLPQSALLQSSMIWGYHERSNALRATLLCCLCVRSCVAPLTMQHACCRQRGRCCVRARAICAWQRCRWQRPHSGRAVWLHWPDAVIPPHDSAGASSYVWPHPWPEWHPCRLCTGCSAGVCRNR